MSYTELKAKIYEARKLHRCAWCAQNIVQGERYFYRSYVWEGCFGSDHMHLECKTAMDMAPVDVLMDGWTPGDFPRGRFESHLDIENWYENV